jgi:hypothetical protein
MPSSPDRRAGSIERVSSAANAHADKVMDELFADIEELLSGDLSVPHPNRGNTATANKAIPARTTSAAAAAAAASAVKSTLDRDWQRDLDDSEGIDNDEGAQIPSPAVANDPAAVPTPSKNRRPPTQILMRVLITIAILTAGISGGLWWLLSTHKLNVNNLDRYHLGWLKGYFQSQSVPPDDSRFAEYLRRALDKADRQPKPNVPTPAATNPSVLAPTELPDPNASMTPARNALAKINTTGVPSAIVETDGKSQTFRVGDLIGDTGWKVVAIAKNEVTVKRGSEVKSLFIGQKF